MRPLDTQAPPVIPMLIGGEWRTGAQTDEVRSGGSYISQSDFRLHFGLGRAEKIESLEVRWPSGKVETFENLAADRFYALLEGEGVVPAERIRPVSHIPCCK